MLPELEEASKRRDLIVSVGISREMPSIRIARPLAYRLDAGKIRPSEFEPVTGGGRRRQGRVARATMIRLKVLIHANK